MDISELEQLKLIIKSLNRIYEEVEEIINQEDDTLNSLPDDEQHYSWRNLAYENVDELESVLDDLDVIIDKIRQIKENNE